MLSRSRIIVAGSVVVLAAGAVLLGCSKDDKNPTSPPPGGVTLNISLPAGGGTGSAVFNTAGNTPYHCGIHPGMLGNVVVDTNTTVTLVDVAAVGTMSWNPSAAHVRVGGTVRWSNPTSAPHTVVND